MQDDVHAQNETNWVCDIYDSILGVESLSRIFYITYYNWRAYIKRFIYTLFAK